MSDNQKQQRPGATPIKNPLLSASVTGLTFDDFPNKPLLLPAAPPIVHAPVVAPVVTPSGLLTREHKSLVTVGSSSLDTENLDEINLNTSNEDNQPSDLTSDLNANPLLEQSNQGVNSDSILSQAASSFSALPSVASNVFSTFSKRITAISSRETTPFNDLYQQDSNSNSSAPQLEIQPTYTQQQPGGLAQAPPPFYASSQGGNYFSSNQPEAQANLTPAEPPKLYTPTEVPTIPPSSAGPPTNLGGQNNFRFSSKKKLYAPIPGLSDQNPITLEPPSASAPITYDSSYGGNTVNNFYQQPQASILYSEDPKADDRKVGSGLFSKISNLAPTGVLQNITGLVQSAAGSITQTIKADSYQQALPSNFEQHNNYFGGSATPSNYLVTSTSNEGQINPPNTQSPSELCSDQQSSQVNFFNQQPTADRLPPASTLFEKKASATASQVQIPFFNPSNLPPSLNPSPQPNRPPSRPSSHSSYLPTNPDIQSSSSFLNPTEPNLIPSPSVPLFNPTFNPLPPTTDHKIPPPSGGNTSYRLQKGTKLYKNPLTPQETASIHVTPNQIQPVNTYPTQPGFSAPQSVPLVAPPPVSNETTQSVSLFAPVPVSNEPVVSSVPLFAPPPVSNESTQSVPLFVPPPTQSFTIFAPANETVQSVSLFDPPPVSNSPSQNVPLFVQPSKPVQSAPSAELKSEPSQSFQSVDFFGPSYNKPEQILPSFSPAAVESTKSSVEPIENIPSIPSQQKHSHCEELIHSAPPVKKLKYNEPVETEPSTTENTSLEELKTNESQNIATQFSNQDINPEVVDNNELQTVKQSFVEENNSKTPKDVIGDSLEQTLEKLSLKTELTLETKKDRLPPITTIDTNLFNPYRGSSNTETLKSSANLPTLSNFFAPLPPTGSGGLNFFATQDNESEDDFETANFFAKLNSGVSDVQPDLIPLEPFTAVQPPISAFFPKLPPSLGVVPTVLEDKTKVNKHLNEPFVPGSVPPPIGFESFTQPESNQTFKVDNNTIVPPENTNVQTIQPQQPEIVNRFSNYFNQTNPESEIIQDSSNFFDSFPSQQQPPQLQQQQEIKTAPAAVVTNEEQRIQHFFNNPPPKDASAVGDLNYDLVHSGLGIKNIQQRSLTPISNLVEPPSSACSEFSEISNSTAGQKSFVANLSITENSEKSVEKEEIKSLDNSVTQKEDLFATTDNKTKFYEELPEEILKELRMANIISADKLATATGASVSYKPAVKHWFFKRTVDEKQIWVPFSHYDSAIIETSLETDDKPNIVAVHGGRYDVNISERKMMSVYWESEPIEVKRCSWFYKALDSKYVPYEEQTAEILENEYKQAAESGVWHKTIILGMGEQVVFHGPTVIVHFQQQQNADAWGGTTQTATRPRVVKRDLDDFNIEQGESQKVDHLLFMVHGIGSACDLKMRSVEEVVEDFRTIARQLVQSHYKNSSDLGLVGRVEVLPISWHSHLHSVEMGIDEKLRMITLESIPKLRNFTNDTLLDILFYTSPTFCQKIMNTIVSSMNALYTKYRERHPEFNGGVSLAGHSLGSLILFDLLCHQNPIKESEEKNLENPDQFGTSSSTNTPMDSNQLEDNQISYTMGPAGTGQPFISYGQLIFQPKKFFALGSPIGMFVTIRGIDKLGLDFRLPTCPGFYNIFHPYDPVAYRIEALVNPDLSGIRPVLIPHHKGRKRMHLELKETMTRVSMDLKNRFLDKFKTTLDSVNIFASTSKSRKEAEEMMEKEVDKVIQMQIQLEKQSQNTNSPEKLSSRSDASATPRQRTESVSTAMSDDVVEIDFPLGKLNDSKRIDYVLQEAPLEFINEYIFALSSHVCYWDSEDTILFVMKEIYSGLGISPDSQVPQQTMTIERPSSRNSLLSSS